MIDLVGGSSGHPRRRARTPIQRRYVEEAQPTHISSPPIILYNRRVSHPNFYGLEEPLPFQDPSSSSMPDADTEESAIDKTAISHSPSPAPLRATSAPAPKRRKHRSTRSPATKSLLRSPLNPSKHIRNQSGHAQLHQLHSPSRSRAETPAQPHAASTKMEPPVQATAHIDKEPNHKPNHPLLTLCCTPHL